MIIRREIKDFTVAHQYRNDGTRFLLEKYEGVPDGIVNWWDINCDQNQDEVLAEIGEKLSSADELIMASWIRTSDYFTYFLQIRNAETDVHWHTIVFDFVDEYVALEFKLTVS